MSAWSNKRGKHYRTTTSFTSKGIKKVRIAIDSFITGSLGYSFSEKSATSRVG